jgi:hypothetical protein
MDIHLAAAKTKSFRQQGRIDIIYSQIKLYLGQSKDTLDSK